MKYSINREKKESGIYLTFVVLLSDLNIIFFKPGQMVWQKRCYIGQGEFQAGHQAKLFFGKN